MNIFPRRAEEAVFNDSDSANTAEGTRRRIRSILFVSGPAGERIPRACGSHAQKIFQEKQGAKERAARVPKGSVKYDSPVTRAKFAEMLVPAGTRARPAPPKNNNVLALRADIIEKFNYTRLLARLQSSSLPLSFSFLFRVEASKITRPFLRF